MDTNRLNALLARFPGLKIAVVGDFFLDKYLYIEQSLVEISLETGLEAYQVVEVRPSPGAAGTVTSNLRAMGVSVMALGIIGEDGEGFELRRGLSNTGVDTSRLLAFPGRFTPTYTKPMLRDLDGTIRELNRLDIRNRSPIPRPAEDELVVQLRQVASDVDGIVVADQVPEPECGVITSRLRQVLSELAVIYPSLVITVDSRDRIGLFRNVILKPNAREAMRAVFPESDAAPAPATLASCGRQLHRLAGRPVFITAGQDGILVATSDGEVTIPALPVEGPIDVVGAGDATMAGLSAALCAGASHTEAATIGCRAAWVTLQQIGTTGTATRAQIAACPS